MLADLLRYQYRTVGIQDVLLRSHAFDLSIGRSDLLSESGTTDQLQGQDHLEVDAEPSPARNRIGAVSHEPLHPLGSDAATREPHGFGFDEGHAQDHRSAAGHDEHATPRLHWCLERSLN